MEEIPEWIKDHYHRIITGAGFTHTGGRDVVNSFSLTPHPDPKKAYRVKAVYTYVRKIQDQNEKTREHVEDVMKSLEGSLKRLERKLYPHRKRIIQVLVEPHPLSETAKKQEKHRYQDYWRIIVQELEEFDKKPRRT